MKTLSLVIILLLCAAPAWAQQFLQPRDLLLQNAAVATGNGADFPVKGFNTVAVELTISNSATVTFEGSVLGTYSAIPCTNKATGASANTATATGLYQCDVAGMNTFRTRISTYASGSVTAYARTTTSVPQSSGSGTAGGLLDTTFTGRFPAAVVEADAIANPTLTQLSTFMHGYNGATWDRLQVDASKFLKVNCATGCSGGASTPADAFANPTTAGLSMGFNMGWNGATWDRLQVDASKNLKAVINAALPTGTNVIGGVTPSPATSGGASSCYLTSAATTNATTCKASAGQIYGVELVNTTATTYYLRLYNLSAAPTCSSATGFIRTIPILAVGGLARDISVGEAYGTGIGFCLTGGGSSTDNTNAATGVYVTIHYK